MARLAEPVVNARRSSVSVLGSSGNGFAFETPGAATTLAGYVSSYLRHRRFWWDREDSSDSLASQLLFLMPSGSQTVLANVFLTYNGTLQFAASVAWDRPPASFDDTSRLAMPFVYIVGAGLVSSMAVVRMRGIEESQISYSNLQAHELRTPLHQILAITQLLRSSMRDMAAADEGSSSSSAAIPSAPGATVDPTLGSLAHRLPERVVASTLQQVRDLMPFLDAIDTSGKILHGIVDNILTFLDLTDKDAAGELGSLGGNGGRTPLTIGALLEELIRDAYEADKLSRSSLEGGAQGSDTGTKSSCTNAQNVTKSTVFEIIPVGLGDAVMEDEGGALRRALQRILANAYRYLDDGGCVEIYLDDVHSLLPPEGCEVLQPAVRRVSLKIIDSGRGMSTDFVKERLGEPWAKEDPYATGSGLSVHLAYRIIELIGGYMEISSAPGKGCSVSIEVPLPSVTAPAPSPPVIREETRRIAVEGFTRFHDPHCALKRIGAMLERTYAKLGHEVVADPADADLVVVEGTLALTPEGTAMLASLRADLVLFVGEDATPYAQIMALLSKDQPGRSVRVLKEPLTPAAIAASAASAAAELTPAPEVVAEDGWRPKNVAESIAALCLGDYFSSRRSARLPPPTASSSSVPSSTQGSASSASGTAATPSTPPSTHSSPLPASRFLIPEYSPLYEDEEPALPPVGEVTSVLVVEDNVINRKILVKILRQALGKECELAEATDGKVALEMFKELSRRRPIIVLLDINMPVLDGWATASEMRALEREREKLRAGIGRKRRPSKIFAVTALAGQNEKRRGLVECGFDGWLTKPCDRDTLCRVVEGARRELQGLAT